MSGRRFFALATALLVALAAPLGAVAQDFQPDAPIALSPEIPTDVDPTLRDALLGRGEIMLAHRLFERQQWAAFVALNWPRDADGKPAASLAAAGQPGWTRWMQAFEVFRPDGARPPPWGSPARAFLPEAGRIQHPLANALTPLPIPAISSRDARVLHDFSAIARVQVGAEVDQAFSFTIWDRNGNPAYYETLLNQVEYDFIVGNGLYHAGGIADYMARNGGLTFPAGRFDGNRLGAIELKLAWRILDPKTDDFSRYLTQPAYLPDRGRSAWVPVMVGLVGFHIAQKTETSPQWIWSTFEHVDNLAVDRLAKAKAADGGTIPLAASFNDPACEWCPVNVTAPRRVDGRLRTQIARLQAIPKETDALNALMRTELARAGSKLAYYQMIGTQWPTDPAAKPGSGPNGVVANVSGGKPLPVYLANAVMETFAQVGNTRHPDQEGQAQTGDRLVFQNGSCMACHASSPYDFSWILTKAQPQPRSEPLLPPPSSP
jgi:hypothetical protein